MSFLDFLGFGLLPNAASAVGFPDAIPSSLGQDYFGGGMQAFGGLGGLGGFAPDYGGGIGAALGGLASFGGGGTPAQISTALNTLGPAGVAGSSATPLFNDPATIKAALTTAPLPAPTPQIPGAVIDIKPLAGSAVPATAPTAVVAPKTVKPVITSSGDIDLVAGPGKPITAPPTGSSGDIDLTAGGGKSTAERRPSPIDLRDVASLLKSLQPQEQPLQRIVQPSYSGTGTKAKWMEVPMDAPGLASTHPMFTLMSALSKRLANVK